MNHFVYYTSIFANLVFVAFLGCLIYSTARTMRAVQHLNPLWFVLVPIAIIVLVAVVGMLRSLYRRFKSTGAWFRRSRRGESKPAPAGS